jgi:peptidoglycan hydrolase-like protein with peptidoglycan-binding domain
VAAGDDPKEGGSGKAKGFAGLASLASDVDIPPPPTKKVESPAPANPSSQAGETTQRQTPSSRYRAPPQPTTGSTEGATAAKWILGILAGFGVLWVITSNNVKTETPAPGHSYTPATQTQQQTQKPQGLAVPKVPTLASMPAEVQPSVGSNLVLSIQEIQYCLAEDIRMDGAKVALNDNIEQDVDRFNALVADYNSRCSHFRYRRGALESARQAIEPFRAQYLAGGRSRFVSSAPVRTSSAPSAPDPRLYDIQNRLNNLGYHAETADGYMGLATRNSILAFQRENGLTANGEAGPELLVQLIRAKPRGQSSALVTQNNPSPPDNQIVLSNFGQSGSLAFGDNENQQGTSPLFGGVQGVTPKQSSANKTDANSALTERAATASVSRQPDVSRANATERASIESACGYHKSLNDPAAYYDCVATQMKKLSNSSGMPDMSRANATERASIESTCGYNKALNGPADYYECVSGQMSKLGSTPSMPDMSRANASERASIESACRYHKTLNGPAAYYECVTAQMKKLSNSSGMPDMSRANASERASIENTCGYHKTLNGPADYYNCVRTEFSKLAY